MAVGHASSAGGNNVPVVVLAGMQGSLASLWAGCTTTVLADGGSRSSESAQKSVKSAKCSHILLLEH